MLTTNLPTVERLATRKIGRTKDMFTSNLSIGEPLTTLPFPSDTYDLEELFGGLPKNFNDVFFREAASWNNFFASTLYILCWELEKPYGLHHFKWGVERYVNPGRGRLIILTVPTKTLVWNFSGGLNKNFNDLLQES